MWNLIQGDTVVGVDSRILVRLPSFAPRLSVVTLKAFESECVIRIANVFGSRIAFRLRGTNASSKIFEEVGFIESNSTTFVNVKEDRYELVFCYANLAGTASTADTPLQFWSIIDSNNTCHLCYRRRFKVNNNGKRSSDGKNLTLHRNMHRKRANNFRRVRLDDLGMEKSNGDCNNMNNNGASLFRRSKLVEKVEGDSSAPHVTNILEQHKKLGLDKTTQVNLHAKNIRRRRERNEKLEMEKSINDTNNTKSNNMASIFRRSKLDEKLNKDSSAPHVPNILQQHKKLEMDITTRVNLRAKNFRHRHERNEKLEAKRSISDNNNNNDNNVASIFSRSEHDEKNGLIVDNNASLRANNEVSILEQDGNLNVDKTTRKNYMANILEQEEKSEVNETPCWNFVDDIQPEQDTSMVIDNSALLRTRANRKREISKLKNGDGEDGERIAKLACEIEVDDKKGIQNGHVPVVNHVERNGRGTKVNEPSAKQKKAKERRVWFQDQMRKRGSSSSKHTSSHS